MVPCVGPAPGAKEALSWVACCEAAASQLAENRGATWSDRREQHHRSLKRY